MSHPTEQELVLHYYSETDDLFPVEHHLGVCAECRALYDSIEITLAGLNALDVPERSPGYSAEVWARLQPALPASRAFRWFPPASRWIAAGAALAALLVLAFLAGRWHPPSSPPTLMVDNLPAPDRVLLTAVASHLERSQIVLTELVNGTAPLDISFEQQRAADLLGENRLYRQSAAGAGDVVVASVLDELERVLLEIEHAPSRLSPADLDQLRLRLSTEGILFKLRVLGSNVRNREEPARDPL
jgi:hypothetical protein